MNLNRRDFAKTSLGGLLALVIPGKMKRKREFPRYFAPTDASEWGWPPVMFVAKRPDCVVQRCADYDIRLEASTCSQTGRVLAGSVIGPLVAGRDYHPFTVANAEGHVADGRWKEITAAEAEALLKPKSIPWQPQRMWRICGNTGTIMPEGTYIGTG